jgi:hypothetical protein
MQSDKRAIRRWILMLALPALYVLHQDVWYWRSARPLVFGLFPIGLFYHVCYSIAAAVLMALIVRYGWPDHLEESAYEAEPQSTDAERRR